MTPHQAEITRLIAALVDRGTWDAELPQPPRFWYDLLEQAAQNRLLYATSHAILRLDPLPVSLRPALQRVVDSGEAWQARLKATLQFVVGTFQNHGIAALIVRTAQAVPYVTFDVDVLVRPSDFQKAVAVLQEQGATITSHDTSLGGRRRGAQVNVRKNGLLTIDLHQDFTWQHRSYMDEEYVWKAPSISEIQGVMVPTPRPEAALLIALAHLACESFYLTLNDLLQLRPFLARIEDPASMATQVARHGWTQGYGRIVRLWDTLSRSVLPWSESTLPAHRLQMPPSAVESNASCPAWLPWGDVTAVFLEPLWHRRAIDVTALAYAGYCRIRQCVPRSNQRGARRWPYYDNWFNLAELQESPCGS